MRKAIAHEHGDDMRPEYAFAAMKGSTRGKCCQSYREATNIVLLQPDVAEAYPTEDGVNESLRGILSTTRAIRKIGGLPDRTLTAGSRAAKRNRRG